jgi:hypothetical protein
MAARRESGMKIGFIGLGLMVAPIVGRLPNARHELHSLPQSPVPLRKLKDCLSIIRHVLSPSDAKYSISCFPRQVTWSTCVLAASVLLIA